MELIQLSIDARHLVCPAPLLKARHGLNQLKTGDRVEVFATDSASVSDFHRLVELTKHKLVVFEEQGRIYRYVLEKG